MSDKRLSERNRVAKRKRKESLYADRICELLKNRNRGSQVWIYLNAKWNPAIICELVLSTNARMDAIIKLGDGNKYQLPLDRTLPEQIYIRQHENVKFLREKVWIWKKERESSAVIRIKE